GALRAPRGRIAAAVPRRQVLHRAPAVTAPAIVVRHLNVGTARRLKVGERSVLTAIGKTSVTGPVAVGPLGLAGDEQADLSVHGGLAKAVYAYPAAHYAVADGKADYAFVYLNIRMAAGRSEAVKKKAGDELLADVRAHFAPIFDKRHIGITLQIDESPGQVYDGKHSNLHPL
ncbi:hypothetical protein KXX48_000487, partial [Aspergillus fumigatus]